ncbi:MAG TPA: CDP-glucose 4,6-dehydratase [Rhodocyclaceae bacterium]
MNRAFWKGRRVFLTGHTGFKGGWLALWLADMGAEVHGYALQPPTQPSLFDVAALPGRLASSVIGDLRDGGSLAEAMGAARPEVVFHLAAQALVRRSYDAPVDTFATNAMGTVNLLEAVRQVPGIRAVVNVTSDKCYDNREWVWPYRENEALGGLDPYSSSKACAELITAAYRHSFLAPLGVHLATARAGNVVGGGDWAADRLVPDFLRALDGGQPLLVRSPGATRPWQHVLEPLSGYLTLAERLHDDGQAFAEAWNFGPAETDQRSVAWIAERLCAKVQGAAWHCQDVPRQPHEARALSLDSSKARAMLGWRPRWHLDTALDRTLSWHRCWRNGDDMAQVTLAQIREYDAEARDEQPL